MALLCVLKHCLSVLKRYFRKDIDCMEKVKRRATKMVYGFGNLTFEERLERLNLFSLQYKRMRGRDLQDHIWSERCKFISVFE